MKIITFYLIVLYFFITCGFSLKAIANSNQRNNYTYTLEGEWYCQFDPKDVGINELWFNNSEWENKIQLPGTTSSNRIGEIVDEARIASLTDDYAYLGVVWYQREIEISSNWADRHIIFHIERVIMRSTVWVNGKMTGDPIDFLGVPHRHHIGSLAPGKHVITVRIDNRNVLNASLGKGHHYYEGMQTIWNGMVGDIELIALPQVSMDLVRIFPSYKNSKIDIEITVNNRLPQTTKLPLDYIIREKSSQVIVAQNIINNEFNPGINIIKQEIVLKNKPLPWDEFQPNLYQIDIKLGSGEETDFYETNLGFRDLGSNNFQLTINERPFLYRSNHDGGMFPLTGYPPTDIESWQRILSIYKSHGLNGIRFHSWTPPKAAFEAADELGIYIQSEHFWNRPDATPEMSDFVRQTMMAAIDYYGNHPSNCFVLFGNELGGDLNLYGSWLKEKREYDNRRLYSVAAGRRVKGDDFSNYGVKMNWAAPFTDWDYSTYFHKNYLNIPEITHELGQPVTHPNWQEIEKYTGVLKPHNYKIFYERARKAGVEHQSAQFQKASGNINRLNYKYDIEALLRTPESAGYSLLDMHDYSGQGAALVGWLDAFYDEKGFLTAEEFSQYGSATVPLARLPKFVFNNGETLVVTAQIAHYSSTNILNAELIWTIRNENLKKIASGSLLPVDVFVGAVTDMGEIKHELKINSVKGEKLNLEFHIAGTDISNNWDIWVFPENEWYSQPDNVIITDNVKEAVKALDNGSRVLLLANYLGKEEFGRYANFKPSFWSTNYSFGQQSLVSGAVVNNNHPALAQFPTSDVLDWQWQTLSPDYFDYDENPSIAWRDLPRISNPNGRGFLLDGFPADYTPIVQPVPDFQNPAKIGTIFELKTSTNGYLLVCGYDIDNQLDSRPAARQLRKSLLAYMSSDDFSPTYEVSNNWLFSTFEQPVRKLEMPVGYENAYLYIKAGENAPAIDGNYEWNHSMDFFVSTLEGINYSVTGATILVEDGKNAWAGNKIHVSIKADEAISGILKVRFHDWKSTGSTCVVQSEDGQQQTFIVHNDGLWVEFLLRREDSLDGEIILEAELTEGSALNITDVVIIPR